MIYSRMDDHGDDLKLNKGKIEWREKNLKIRNFN